MWYLYWDVCVCVVFSSSSSSTFFSTSPIANTDSLWIYTEIAFNSKYVHTLFLLLNSTIALRPFRVLQKKELNIIFQVDSSVLLKHLQSKKRIFVLNADGSIEVGRRERRFYRKLDKIKSNEVHHFRSASSNLELLSGCLNLN